MESSGYVLSEAAEYSYKCQDVYKDVVSFAAAIPEHLRALFLIPIKAEVTVASTRKIIAKRVAYETSMDGSTPEGDLFSYQTFVNHDLEPTVPNSDPGSIFEDSPASARTKHQEYNFDENIQSPTDTSYMSDVDITQYVSYPYRTNEKPVRHSFNLRKAVIIKMALTPEYVETKAPKKIQDNAEKCTVKLMNYDNPSGVFTFSVVGNTDPRSVQAALVKDKHIALSCDCPFWRFNGPEYHAKVNNYLIGEPQGLATEPKVRDPDKKYWLCKHTYAVLKRFEKFLDDVYEEVEEEDIEDAIDEKWTMMEEAVEVPVEDMEDDVISIDWEDEQLKDEESTPEEEQVQITQDDYEVVEPEDDQMQLTQDDYEVIEEEA